MALKSQLLDIVEKFNEQRVVVIGDVVLDKSEYCSPVKMSAEAPCFVLRKERETYSPGGAGNVFANIASLGGTPYLIGVIGDDGNGDILRLKLINQLREGVNNGELAGLLTVGGRKTSVKRRTYAETPHYCNQKLRVDEEDLSDVGEDIIRKMISLLERRLQGSKVNICVFSDYGKGVLNKESGALFLDFCKRNGLMAIVDPKPTLKDPSRIRMYKGSFGFKPNIEEAGIIAGISYERAEDSLEEISERCLNILEPEGFLLITHGGEGMHLYFPDGKEEYIQPVKVDVADITGAGDTVLGALSLSLAADASISDAARIANFAASRKVTKKGTATVTKRELVELIEERSTNL